MNSGPIILKAIRALWAANSHLAPITILPWDKVPSEDDSAANAPPYANLRCKIGRK